MDQEKQEHQELSLGERQELIKELNQLTQEFIVLAAKTPTERTEKESGRMEEITKRTDEIASKLYSS